TADAVNASDVRDLNVRNIQHNYS
ncbi:hypothetical protein Q604_UNBC01085G0001, partial [human gut metagenome]